MSNSLKLPIGCAIKRLKEFKDAKVLLIGAGHAHLEAVKQLSGLCQLTLINNNPVALYSGMMPGVVAGHYGIDEASIDLKRLCAQYGCDLQIATLTSLRQLPPHDVLSLNIGSTTDAPQSEYDWPLKPFHTLMPRLETLAHNPIHIIGAGAAGVEMALALRHRLSTLSHLPSITLYSARGNVLAGFPTKMQALAEHALALANITVVQQKRLSQPSDTLTLWATGSKPTALAHDFALAHDGYIAVHDTLEVKGARGIFAVGDCASVVDAASAWPKQGTVPVRQAAVLVHNIKATLSGQALTPYQHEEGALAILSLGERNAIAMKWGHCVQGHMMWRLKDFIDRRFVRRYAA